MRFKRFIITALLLFGSGLRCIQAQESVNASGGNASGSAGSVSYSVGQVEYKAQGNASGSVSQGVQQLYDIFVLIGYKEAEAITLRCSVFPNPSNDFLTLKVDASQNFNIQGMYFQLFNTNGILLTGNSLTGNETSIDMSKLLPATYILKIMNDTKEVKTFKIIKNQAQ